MSKIIVVLGPTATGKSDLAVLLAQKYGGEVISADSRQTYRGLDIATGKITKKEMQGIPHHLIDVASPRTQFTAAEWQTQAKQKITEIIGRGNIPIICGGTGFYIQSIVDNIVLPEVPPNTELRNELANKPASELYALLKKMDPVRARNIDEHNPVRLIRSIEIATALGRVPSLRKLKNTYDILQIGLTADTETTASKIHTRIVKRIKKGMIAEAHNLHAQGLSYKRMRELGLEYRYLADFLQEKLDQKNLVQEIYKASIDYAKRQMTWFKRDSRIHWFTVAETPDGRIEKKVLTLTKRFLASSSTK